MASQGKQFLFILSILIISVICESQIQLPDTTRCEESCRGELMAQEFGKDKVNACYRGCRFLSISKFLARRFSNVQQNCADTCGEAYAPVSIIKLLDPCIMGCNFQNQPRNSEKAIPLDDTRQNPLTRVEAPNSGDVDAPEMEGEGVLVNLGPPVMQVRKVMAQVLGRIHIIKSSIVTYFMPDNNTLLAVQSEPVIVVQIAPEGVFPPAEMDNNDRYGNGEGEAPSFLDRMNSQLFGRSSDSEDPPRNSGSLHVRRVALNQSRYGYLLHLLLLLAVVSMSLLGLSYCLAVARHQQRKTFRATNMHVALHEPLKLVRPEDLTKLSLMEEEECGQAPPLPIKQDLNLKHADV